jgi:hypothetical protein
VLDVAAMRVQDLYNDFDKNAPFIRRDLDQDLADYLVECAREIGSSPFTIRFTFETLPGQLESSRITNSIYNYFVYLAESEHQSILRMFRRSAILLAIGISILFAAVSVSRMLGPDPSVTANVFVEGLTVAAWVSLWEAIAIFLIEWFPHRKNVALFRRLAQARLIFRSTKELESNQSKERFNNNIESKR